MSLGAMLLHHVLHVLSEDSSCIVGLGLTVRSRRSALNLLSGESGICVLARTAPAAPFTVAVRCTALCPWLPDASMHK
jgi:hypothetical protein